MFDVDDKQNVTDLLGPATDCMFTAVPVVVPSPVRDDQLRPPLRLGSVSSICSKPTAFMVSMAIPSHDAGKPLSLRVTLVPNTFQAT